MKAGILTFHNTLNYGACLQAFATQEVLKRMGVDVKIIDYRSKALEVHYSLHHYKSLLKYKGISTMLPFIAADVLNLKLNYFESKTFNDWYENNYILTSKCKSLLDLKKCTKDYDVCIVGSDQVWNSEITEGYDDAYFLDFCNFRTKRISYAASIGKDVLTSEDVEFLSTKLSKFDNISLREATHIKTLSETLNRNVENVVDPTLILTSSEWNKALNIGSPLVKEKYIFFHSINSPTELTNAAIKLQKATSLRIVRIGKHSKFDNEMLFKAANPTDFVNLISNAEYIVTDSFHGLAFSIIYRKQFISILGNGRNSRILNLLTQIGLKNNAYKDFAFETLEDIAVNYSENVENRISELRSFGKSFLENEFNSEAYEYDDKLFRDKETCCGCGLCKAICSQNAIEMKMDDEGFLYPHIIKERCIDCGKCEKNCAFKKDQTNKFRS